MICQCVCSICGKVSDTGEYASPDEWAQAQDRLSTRLREQGWTLEEEDTCPTCASPEETSDE